MLKITPKKRVLFVRRVTPVLLVIFGVFSLLTFNLRTPQIATADSSDTVNFQARLQTAAGAIAPDGDYNIAFKLYDDPSAGGGAGDTSCSGDADCLWTESYTGGNKVTVKNGYFSVRLGSQSGFGDIDWSQQLYLTMNIGGTGGTASWDGEMDPRLALTATPYAFQAKNADNASTADTAGTAETLSDTVSGNLRTLSFQGSASGTQNFVIDDQADGAGTYHLLTSEVADGSFVQLQTGGSDVTQTGDIDIAGTVTTTNITIGDATDGGEMINNGVTVNTAVTLSNFSSSKYLNGSGTPDPTATVDVHGMFIIPQTSLGVTVTLPDPSDTIDSGRIIYISNTGSATLTLTSDNGGTATVPGGATAGMMWVYNDVSGTGKWKDIGATNGVSSVGSINSGGSKVANGAQIVGNALILQTADDTSNSGAGIAGLVSNTSQGFKGAKTFDDLITASMGVTVDGAVLTANNGLTAAGTISLGTTAGNNVTIGNSTGTVGITGSTIGITGTTTVTGSLSSTSTVNGATGLQTSGSTRIDASGNFSGGTVNGDTLSGTALTFSGTTGTIGATGTNNSVTVLAAGTGTLALQASATGGILIGTTAVTTVTIGNATSGGLLVNNGATRNTAKALGDITGSNIGSAASTVDAYTYFTIAQATTSITASIPAPTDGLAGRIIYISNIGSTSITLGGTAVANGTSAEFIYNGSSWTLVGVNGSGSLTGIGTFNSANSYANGATISGSNIVLGSADGTTPGILNGTTQTIAGAKTWSDLITGNAGAAVNGGTVSLNTTGIADTTIGNSTGTVGIAGSTITFTGNTSVTGTIIATSTIQGTQLKSTVTTGTAPLTVASTTKVTNLNADQLDGIDSTGFLQTGTSAGGDITGTFNNLTVSEIQGKAVTITSLANTNFLVYNGTAWVNESFSGDLTVSNTGVATIAANAVALGTDTTGNYVAGLTNGTNVSITGTAGEGWSPTVNVVDNPTFSGLITGQAGLTVTGAAVSLNASSNFGINLGTGTSTGAIAIGGGSNTVAINSSNWDVSSAGVISGLTGVSSSGTITFSGLSTAGVVHNAANGQLSTSLIANADLGSGTYSNITGTGALTAGSINWTGSIASTSTISGSALISTVTTGTAPLTVASTTKVTNLNADQLDGIDSTGFLQTGTGFTGDVSGTYNSLSVDKIKGTAVTITSLTNTNFLVYNGTAWVNKSFSGDISVDNTGAATIATGAVTSAKILDGTITATDIANTTITGGKIAAGTITGGATGNIGSATIDNSNLASGAYGAITSANSLTSASSLVTVGALTGGSIASGFGAINTSNTITGTTITASTGFVGSSIDTSGATTLSVGTGNATAVNIGKTGSAIGITGSVSVTGTLQQGGNTVCTTSASSCNGTYVSLAPGSAQTTSSNNSAIFINDSGTGNLLQLQSSSVDEFIVSNSGTATIKGGIVNNGSTLDTSDALGDVTTTYIGGSTNSLAAAATVDKYTTFTITQATASVSASIPTPTDTTSGRIIYIANLSSSTQSITVGSITLAPGNDSEFLWNGSAWNATAVSTGVSLVGSFTGASIANGASISGNTLTFGAADGTHPGLVTTGTQSFAGAKTFTGGVTISGSTLQANAGMSATGGTIGLGTASGDTVTIGNTSSTHAITLQGDNITQKITGDSTTPTDIVKGNSTGLFQVQSSSSTVFIVDTTHGTVGINTTPGSSYALNVNGVVNSNTGLDVNGVPVCTTACTPSAGSGNYIQNGTSFPGIGENIAIQTISASSPVAIFRGYDATQSADLLDIQAWNGTSVTNSDTFGADASLAINSGASSGSALGVTANGLTTGYGVNIASNSILQTAGSLFNVSDTAQLITNAASITGSLVNVSRNVSTDISGSGTSTPTIDQKAAFTQSAHLSPWNSSTFTVTAGHSNYYIFVSLTDENACTDTHLPTVSVGGTSLTLIDHLGNPPLDGGSCYFLFGHTISSGSNQAITVTDSDTGDWYNMEVDDWYNVNQSTPYGTEASGAGGQTGTANPATAPTIGSSAWTSGHLIVEHNVVNDPTCNVAPSTGQTAIYGDSGGVCGNTIGMYAAYKTSAGGSQTVSWSGGPSDGSGYWIETALDLIGSSASPNGSVTGSVASFSDNCTQTAGTCTDSGNVMSLQQQFSGATGAVLDIQNAGSGYSLLIEGGGAKISGNLVGNTVVDNETATGTNPYTESTPATGYRLTMHVVSAATTDTFNITGVANVEGSMVFVSTLAQKNSGTNSVIMNVNINGVQISTATATTTGVHENYVAMYMDGSWRIIGLNSATAGGSDTADYAEYIDYSGNTVPQPGEVLTVGDDVTSVKDSTTPYDNHVIGVVSTNPYQVGGSDDGHSVVMALTGRVPVKVSTENGPIEPGDPLTSSSTPGVAMKATIGGQIIGTALEAYDGTEPNNEITVQLHVGYDDPNSGTIQGDANVGGGLYVTGNADIEGDLTVAGTTITQDLTVSGNANVAVLSVSGGISADSVTVVGAISGASLTVSGNANFGGDITLNGHFITGGTAPTTAVNAAAAGNAATCMVAGNDTSGTVTLQSQGTGQAAGAQCTLTFSKTFGSAPRTVLSPNDSTSGSMGAYLQSTPTTMTLNFTGVPAAGQTYNYNYFAPQ